MPGHAAAPDALSHGGPSHGALAGGVPPEEVLSVRGLRRSYGAVPVLRGIDLSLRAGSVTVLLGPNGAGKTTLVKSICGRLEPEAGEVTICGIPAAGIEARRRIGLAPQDIALYRPLTAAENLSIFARLGGVPRREVKARVAAVLERTGLSENRDVRIDRMSGGWQRRVNLAAALVGAPRLLVLDEPTVGVDAPAREALVALIRDLAAEGIAVLLVTHDFPFAEAVADRLTILCDGRIVLEGALGALLESHLAHRRAADLTFARVPPPEAQRTLAAAGLSPSPAGNGLAYHGLMGDEARRVSDLLSSLEAVGAPPRTLALNAPGLDALYESVLEEQCAAAGAALRANREAAP